MKSTAAIAALLVGLAAMQGVQAQQQVPIYGVGNWSCGKWIAARDGKDWINENVMLQWGMGHVTAIGSLVHLKVTDADGMKIYFDNYCRANPTVNFVHAVSQLVMTLQNEAQHGQ